MSMCKPTSCFIDLFQFFVNENMWEASDVSSSLCVPIEAVSSERNIVTIQLNLGPFGPPGMVHMLPVYDSGRFPSLKKAQLYCWNCSMESPFWSP